MVGNNNFTGKEVLFELIKPFVIYPTHPCILCFLNFSQDRELYTKEKRTQNGG